MREARAYEREGRRRLGVGEQAERKANNGGRQGVEEQM